MENTIKCEICEKSFMSKQIKAQHLKFVHGEEKKFECNVCSSDFGRMSHLVIHIENSLILADCDI